MLTKDQILSAQDLQREEVDVPEWGGKVWVQAMTGTARDAFEAGILKGGKLESHNLRAKLAVASIVDDKGAPMFTESDIDKLGGKSAAALDRISAVAQRLSGLSEADVKDLEKNSGSGPDEDSPSN